MSTTAPEPSAQVAGHVRITPRFFETAIKDYNDISWAFVREIMQNSADAGSTFVDWRFQEDLSGLVVTIQDNGCGMDREVLVNKLLCLGGSGKEFQNGAVGGFGKAKELLFFAQRSYRIETQDLAIEGEGADYTITETDDFGTIGTKIIVEMDHRFGRRSLVQALEHWAEYAQVPVNVTYLVDEGPTERLTCNMKKGSRRRELESGVVYSNQSHGNLFVCRLNGMPMFYDYTAYKGTVILELTGQSDQILTANRDGLKYPFSSELQQFLTEISVDKRTALKNEEARYLRFHGEKVKHEAASRSNLVSDAVLGNAAFGFDITLNDRGPAAMTGNAGIQTQVLSATEGGASIALGTEFIVKNTTGMVTPDYYQPDRPEFGHYQATLAKMWTRCIVKLHQLFDHSASFAVGFILDEDVSAEFEPDGPYGKVYYLNPASVVTQSKSTSRSFKKRWSLNDKHSILAIAVHEFTHGLGYGPHDEEFAARLTEVMGVVMANMKQFTPCLY